MASVSSQPASAVTASAASGDDAWKHVVPDGDGSLAFDSREQAEAFAKDKGIQTSWKDGKVENSNLVPIGTSWVILDPGQQMRAEKGTSETVASGSEATSSQPNLDADTGKSRSPQSAQNDAPTAGPSAPDDASA